MQRIARQTLTMLFVLCAAMLGRAQSITWYNTDSLLNVLSQNKQVANILSDAINLYHAVGLDTADISLPAFKVAFLERAFMAKKFAHVRHHHRYKRRYIFSIVDYTRTGNRKRLVTIDIRHSRLLFDTLVSQGSGRNELKNNKFGVPVYFSNTVNSEMSSLGLIATQKPKKTTNPCHLCKFAADTRHKDIIVLQGLEKGINDNIKKRDIVVHTTGSKNLSNALPKHFDDTAYRIDELSCRCYHTADDGKVRSITAYASACGLAENNGYMGQSNGCLVLPEDCHISIMKTIKKKSPIFIYSNVINSGSCYFYSSPVISGIIRHFSK